MKHDTQGATPRRKLSDILAGSTDSLRRQWDSTKAADDFRPLPTGTYTAHVQAVELFNARTGTAGIKVTFKVAEGEHVGRLVWHDLWLTPAALPQTKRDCLKLGLDSIDKLESASIEPGRIRCRVRVALRRDDDGTEHNKVRGFDVLGVDDPPSVDDPDFPPDTPAETVEDDAVPVDAAATDEAEAEDAAGDNGQGALIKSSVRPRWAMEVGQ